MVLLSIFIHSTLLYLITLLNNGYLLPRILKWCQWHFCFTFLVFKFTCFHKILILGLLWNRWIHENDWPLFGVRQYCHVRREEGIPWAFFKSASSVSSSKKRALRSRRLLEDFWRVGTTSTVRGWSKQWLFYTEEARRRGKAALLQKGMRRVVT